MANVLFPTSQSQKIENLWNTDHALADEGAYFVATNPTPNTVIAGTTSVVDAANAGATSAQTRPVLIVYNSWAAGATSKSIYPRFLWMMVSQVPTSASFWDVAFWLEPVGASAYVSGGSLITAVTTNPLPGIISAAVIHFGALTAAATTTGGTLVSRRRIDNTVPVTLDEWIFLFGDVSVSSDVLSGGTVVKRTSYRLPPIVIPPGYALKMGMWGTSNAAAPSWEFEFDYAERVSGQ